MHTNNLFKRLFFKVHHSSKARGETGESLQGHLLKVAGWIKSTAYALQPKEPLKHGKCQVSLKSQWEKYIYAYCTPLYATWTGLPAGLCSPVGVCVQLFHMSVKKNMAIIISIGRAVGTMLLWLNLKWLNAFFIAHKSVHCFTLFACTLNSTCLDVVNCHLSTTHLQAFASSFHH